MLKVALKWWIFFAVTSAIGLILLDQTILNVSLPSIQKEFLSSNTDLQWSINAYLLSMTSLVAGFGRLSDLWGRRRIFITGLLIFMITSYLCGDSASIHSLIFHRVFQGVGGAMMLACAQAILMDSFPLKERGLVNGLYVSMLGIFVILGPLLGGFFVENLSWRWIFYINPLVGIPVFIACWILVPHHKVTHKIPMDYVGLFLLTLGVFGTIFGIMQSEVWGWNDPLILGTLLLGIVSLSLFYWVEKQRKYPLFEMAQFNNTVFRVACLNTLVAPATSMISILMASYFQYVLKSSPSQASWMILPALLPVLFLGGVVGHWQDIRGARQPILIGSFLFFIGFTWLSFFIKSALYYPIILGYIVTNTAIVFISNPSVTSAFNIVSPSHRGGAAGIVMTMRQLGSCLGVTVIGVVMSRVQESIVLKYISSQAPNLTSLSFSSLAPILSLQESDLISLYSSYPLNQLLKIKELLLQGFLDGVHLICLIFGFTGLITFFICFRFFKNITPHKENL